MAHEHILTKDTDGAVWVVVLDRGEVRLYPFLGRTAHNGAEERKQFETFVANLSEDNSFHRYEYEGEEETFRMVVVPTNLLAYDLPPYNASS